MKKFDIIFFILSFFKMKKNMLKNLLLFVTLVSVIMVGSLTTVNSESSKVNCNYPQYPTKCECPGSCMKQKDNSSYCVVKKCYKWNSDLNKCENDGKDRISALVLQSIPFTGVFGSGYGNIGRWDIFAIYMSVVFGGCLFVCVIGCCVILCLNDSDSSNDESIKYDLPVKCCINCFVFIWSITILVLWIMGIVNIANKNVLDLNGCQLSN